VDGLWMARCERPIAHLLQPRRTRDREDLPSPPDDQWSPLESSTWVKGRTRPALGTVLTLTRMELTQTWQH
jgi:hypothetical protein